MKLIVFALVFVVLVATSALAQGLQITELDFNVDYDEAYTYRIERRDRLDSGSVSITNGSKIDADVLPGSNFLLTVRVENTFQGEDPEIKGVFVTATIEDIDDGADMEYESLDFDIGPGDDYRFDIKFFVPLDVDEGTYDFILEAEGEDRNDSVHQTRLDLKFEVKKQSHDIRITKAVLNPSVVSCNRKSILVADVMNLGSNPENEIAVEFRSASLGINSYDGNIVLDSSEEADIEDLTYTKTLDVEVPSFLNAGTHPVVVNLYWKNFVLFDQKTLQLDIRDCDGSPKPKTETRIENQVQEQNQDNKQTITTVLNKADQNQNTGVETIPSQGPFVPTQRISLLSSPALVLILLAGLVVIAVVGFLAYRYVKK
ncbi:hypothetical protein CMO83_00220 [Candidatus Woesearchaeota archaeon]|jgi:hypothetical protein|nr:hypothetical protein [Candidatus Woesearchaeota archaeon]MDP6648495.1 hypothetical protein [Candidatus Woesearchaeota archaeon]|tara:strand:+ start:4238 stop:5353 length:1116 start_codon:yes stop_codon:yes gene_type:complete